MFDISTLLVLIPALPLAACLATAVLGRRVLRQRSHVPIVTALAMAALASAVLLLQVHRESRLAAESGHHGGYERIVSLWTWASVPQTGSATASPVVPPRDFRVEVVLRADPLSATMLAMVTLISLGVAIYSIGYMRDDPGYWRFFTYIGLFVFSMTMLVAASNFVLLYVFWEAVGLCSYLLIGFWFPRPAAVAAAKKAFLVNRVGDFGFALGVFLLWTVYGTLDFHDAVVQGTPVLGILGQARLADPRLFVGGGVATAICLLLLLGACGKSAQIPLHIWLPDAMEGPTPVSALIHAATMVTAGVYLLARCSPLWIVAPDAQVVVAVVGGVTALVAAIIAVAQNDLKRILAYSTISQLGYMFLAMGAGTMLGVAAGMFHLITHAFFKALLFLAAGSVMHAMGGVVDLTQLGGLRRRLPITHWTFLIGALALAGIAPLAGFWSKDAILAAVWDRAAAGNAATLFHVLYWAGLLTAGITAFYAFRAFFRTFYGEERIPSGAGLHAHESPRTMTIPLVLLAIGTIDIGMQLEFVTPLESFLKQTPSLACLERHAVGTPVATGGGAAKAVADHAISKRPEPRAMAPNTAVLGTAVGVSGIGLAWLLYWGAPGMRPRLSVVMRLLGLKSLSEGKFFFDPVYQMLIVWPMEGIAQLCAWTDRVVLDGLVDWVGKIPVALGASLRSLQGGLTPFYALAMLLGLLVMLGALLI
jgi:NADH-quinone oxidoreductase subunit L